MTGGGPLKIAIVAGEESGDLLGADIVAALRAATGRPVRLAGLGGRHLEAQGLVPLFDAGEIDEVRLFLAPLLVGGRAARDPLEGQGVERIADATRALTMSCRAVDQDLLVSARLKEW